MRIAQLFLQAAETYLSWAQLGEKLSENLDAIDAVLRGDDAALGVVEAKRLGEPAPAGRPTLRQAIRMVMATDPLRTWKKSQIFDALKQRGWEPKGGKPSSQLATRLAEMIERGEVTRVSVGHYELASYLAIDALLAEETTQGTPLGVEETA